MVTKIVRAADEIKWERSEGHSGGIDALIYGQIVLAGTLLTLPNIGVIQVLNEQPLETGGVGTAADERAMSRTSSMSSARTQKKCKAHVLTAALFW
jgi:hypothetical protein